MPFGHRDNTAQGADESLVLFFLLPVHELTREMESVEFRVREVIDRFSIAFEPFPI
jgi:hypothetical protein